MYTRREFLASAAAVAVSATAPTIAAPESSYLDWLKQAELDAMKQFPLPKVEPSLGWWHEAEEAAFMRAFAGLRDGPLRRRGGGLMADGATMLVCGGRDYTDRHRLWATLDELHRERGVVRVIAGGARGADTMAAEWAEACGISCNVFMANWAELGRKAGPIRNQLMLDDGRPTLVVALPGGRGTGRHGAQGLQCRRQGD